ncbi:MAG: hypothetical protein KDA78_07955 [Planctomycetaceae bacterium]|nr:hypothetical protein [Planctomycetaceae bacterium]
MKKILGIGLGIAITLFAVGFSFAELGEYTRVVKNRMHSAVKDSIPLSVEIERMEVLLTKLDDQVASHKYLVAKSQINLQEAEAELKRHESKSQNLFTEMKHLRSWIDATEVATVCVSGHRVSRTDISTALRHKLSAWKESEATVEACAQTVGEHRKATDALTMQFTEWENQRKLLGHRVEKLKAQVVAQQLKQETSLAQLDQSDLARATRLAEDIEKEIRINEAQAALGTSPLDHVLQEQVDDSADITAEVDAVLNGQEKNDGKLTSNF